MIDFVALVIKCTHNILTKPVAPVLLHILFDHKIYSFNIIYFFQFHKQQSVFESQIINDFG